jgi:hypothetical protein
MAEERDEKKKWIIEELKKHNDGMRYAEIHKSMKENYPGISDGTFDGIIQDLKKKNKIDNPSKGLYISKQVSESPNPTITQNDTKTPIDQHNNQKSSEAAFYKPFANYLKSELEDCTAATALGGKKLDQHGKWTTPDVIGIANYYQSNTAITIETEIVSAEIKYDIAPMPLMVAFGQACAYKLFSHRVYLVIPNTANKEVADRLITLCVLLDIGMVTFNRSESDNPNFRLKHYAPKTPPSPFYVHQVITRLYELKDIAKELKLERD